MRPFFSIVIATYNSERTLEYTLQSIRDQNFNQEELEILIVDGGSTDGTLDLARKYGAKVYSNPHRLPEYAKAIGHRYASGRYLMRMDSDEEFSYKDQLADKKKFYLQHTEIKVLISNAIVYGRKDICGIAASYMNILGDPFSYFMYNTKENKCATYKKNIVDDQDGQVIMRFKKGDRFPLADSATCSYSLDYIKENYPDEYCSINFVCNTYDRIMDDTGVCGCIRKDYIKHNCSSSLNTYLKKLKFRVINNVFHKEESGFSSKSGKNDNKKIVFFMLYALIVPLPILDSVRLMLKYRDWTFGLHFVYLYYVFIQIMGCYYLKLIGKTMKNDIYGK